jgi:hypothetical protein
MFARSILAITALISVAPLMAQGVDKNDAAHQAADAREIPETKALNNQVSAADANAQSAQTQNDANQAQYQSDLAAYEQAVRDQHRQVLANDAAFMRQRQAYAMAMRDWRLQVAACNRGHERACDMPAPNPADYM